MTTNKEAAWLIAVAESAHEGKITLYCGVERKRKRFIVCAGVKDDFEKMTDEYDFVTNDAAVALAWLCEVTLSEKLRVLLDKFKEQDARGDKAGLQTGDEIITLVDEWINGCDVRIEE